MSQAVDTYCKLKYSILSYITGCGLQVVDFHEIGAATCVRAHHLTTCMPLCKLR